MNEDIPNKLRQRFLALCEAKHISEDVAIKEAIMLWICIQETIEAR